jgi:hypothetical protein
VIVAPDTAIAPTTANVSITAIAPTTANVSASCTSSIVWTHTMAVAS